MAKKKYVDATLIGLRLTHSPKSLAFIKHVDPDLYREIKLANKGVS